MRTTQLYYTVWNDHEDEYLTGWKTVALYEIRGGKLLLIEDFELRYEDSSEETLKEYCSKYYDNFKLEWI